MPFSVRFPRRLGQESDGLHNCAAKPDYIMFNHPCHPEERGICHYKNNIDHLLNRQSFQGVAFVKEIMNYWPFSLRRNPSRPLTQVNSQKTNVLIICYMQVRFQMTRAKKPCGRCEKTKKMLHVSRKDAASLEKRRSVVLKKTERCLKNNVKALENRP